MIYETWKEDNFADFISKGKEYIKVVKIIIKVQFLHQLYKILV